MQLEATKPKQESPMAAAKATVGTALDAGTLVSGVVVKSVYTNDENGYGIRILLTAGREEVKLVGEIAEMSQGESVRCVGEQAVDPKFGPQFKVTDFEVLRPTTAAGIQEYLAGIRGIGKILAARIVSEFGDRSLQVIEENPERLSAIEGLRQEVALGVVEAVATRGVEDEAKMQLRALEVPRRFLNTLVGRYKEKAVEVVSADPYAFIGNLKYWGWKTADSVGRAAQIPATSPQRLAAGILEAVNQACKGDGHCCLSRDVVLGKATSLLAVHFEVVDDMIARLIRHHELVQEGDPAKPVAHLFSAKLHAHEHTVAASVRRIERMPKKDLRMLCPSCGGSSVAPPEVSDRDGCTLCGNEGDVPFEPTVHLPQLEESLGIDLGKDQRRAIVAIADHGVVVMTGGPGTGKTTTIKAVLALFEAAGQKVRMAAPTGRAARRMAEAVGYDARRKELDPEGQPSTIHVLLDFDPAEGRFQRDAKSPVFADLIVLDEASMIDVSLARHVLVAVANGTRLLIVGDPNQLPSVGPGKVLEDVLSSGVVPVVELTEIFRQAQDSGIVVNSHKLNTGQDLELENFAPKAWRFPKQAEGPSDFYFFERDKSSVPSTVVELVSQRLPDDFGHNPFKKVQVLIPQKSGPLGCHAVNKALQERLNEHGQKVKGKSFRVGDRVMVTKNDRSRNVYNGDCATVASTDGDGNAVLDFHDGRAVTFDKSQTGDLTLAYAITIHKSQGSEFPVVVIVLHQAHWNMLRRRLIYTAMTRAKQMVVIVGSKKALRHASRTLAGDDRNTRLAARLADPSVGADPVVQADAADAITQDDWECEACLKIFPHQNPSECPSCGERKLRKVNLER